jgi:transcription-repair coupling factor (superfamily II helicase)
MTLNPQPSVQTPNAFPTLGGVVESGVPLAIAGLIASGRTQVLHIAADDKRAHALAASMSFFVPNAKVLSFPSWDVLPYDRASPNPIIVTERLQTLVELANAGDVPLVVIATVAGWLQKLPPPDLLAKHVWQVQKNGSFAREKFAGWLVEHGYRNVAKAVESGEFALRGSIVDIIPSGSEIGYRMDLFGDDIEHIRTFDPLTQKSDQEVKSLTLLPASEVLLTPEHIENFRRNYRDAFGAVSKQDPLYESVSNAQRYSGMEHWLPLFYDKLATLLDYVPAATLTFDEDAGQMIEERHALIQEYFEARKSAENQKYSEVPYHPLSPSQLYILPAAHTALLDGVAHFQFSAFTGITNNTMHFNMRRGLVFADASEHKSPIDRVASLLKEYTEKNKKLLLACYSAGSRERLLEMLRQREIVAERVEAWQQVALVKTDAIALAILPLEHGFETPEALILSEQDVLGERLIRVKKKKRAAEFFMQEAASFNEGELVVHREHGIGRFEKLETLEINGAKHDCLKLSYADGDRLFVPVENIDVLSRYGSEEEGAALDKLGGVHWQARKAKLKERITLAAAELMKTAAERLLKPAVVLQAASDEYGVFADRFGHSETEDQERSIEEVITDLQSGKPMDRLVCGDVGFGKTEVALRAAFTAVKSTPSMQVALVVPTTLLARQHYQNFAARFADLGVHVRQISRMVSAKETALVKAGLKDGSVDIVIGTHALLSKDIQFARLGLVIVDEEQHFGVAQKEKLKALKTDVHVLTLSATPIPRTLQLSLSGVRDLSLITTPPVDRLAVRSFVMPFDPVVLREALLREKHRGGGTFIVTPRIADIGDLKAKISELAPELKLESAHGQMPATQLDDIMNRFYERQIDVLISTAIIESGLDIPHANTIIIHKADRFGLAQLYQMRGRVGRSKVRAYAYFLLPHGKQLTRQATRRLEVMQTLDRLGAGFTLASHDMDIRGFGNLVGEEQSGHVREVGIELYQHMLAEAVDAAKAKNIPTLSGEYNLPQVVGMYAEDWSPQINLGISVLIPESYVEDLSLRMGLYRRIADARAEADINALAVEMIDRFGQLPDEVQALFDTMTIKQFCRELQIEKLDAGPKGLVLHFRPLSEERVAKLMQFIASRPTSMKLRPDQSVLVSEYFENAQQKIQKIKTFLHGMLAKV